MRIIILSFVLLFYSSISRAQVKSLPYKNGFGTSADKAAFTSVRTGVTTTSDWSYYTGSDHYAAHDYPVGGSSTDTVSDWLFSPPIKITAGAALSFRYYVYGITGTATPSDEFSVWYGKRNTNPKNGTYVKLADLTHKISSTMSDWKDTSGILLPFVADTGYVVFRYKATNNWFTLGIDSVVVKIPGMSIQQVLHPGVILNILPNPCFDMLKVSVDTEVMSLKVTGMDGKVLYAAISPAAEHVIYTSQWQNGAYMLLIETKSGVMCRKFIKN